MKRLLWIITILLIASPAFSQEALDLGGFLGGGVGDLLNIDAPRGAPARGAPARGAAPARGGAPTGPPVDRLVKLREMLGQQNAPLAKEQETAINSLLDTEILSMRQVLARRILELGRAKAAAAGALQSGPPPVAGAPAGTPASSPGAPSAPQTPPAAAQNAPRPPASAPAPAPGATPFGAAGRGGPPGVPPAVLANLPSPEEIAPDINRLNDQLLGKIAAAPALTPPQQAIVKKLYRDQVKSRGGFEAIKLTMEDAGAPFTPDQVAQIQPLFDEKERTKAQMTKEAAGQPVEKAKLDQLDRDTLSKVLKLLTPPQRTALLTPPKP